MLSPFHLYNRTEQNETSCSALYQWCTDTPDPEHFGPKTLGTQDISDPGHFGPKTLQTHDTSECRSVQTLWHYFTQKNCFASEN